MYDPAADTWTAKRPITNVSAESYDDAYGTTLIVRNNAVAFVLGDFGYLCTGQENGNILKTVWEYNFSADTWTQKIPFTGLERTAAMSFSVMNRGFVVGGYNSRYQFDGREGILSVLNRNMPVSLTGMDKRSRSILS